jgi:hypothetical protein
MTEHCGALAVLFLVVPATAALAQVDENPAIVITRPERTLEQVDKIYAGMPPVSYVPPVTRWDRLSRTAAVLAGSGGEFRVVMLGDSIVNDTSRSCWDLVLQRSYPKVKILKTTCVRGSTGCWWYKRPDRLQRYVLDLRPDLLILGGISHRDDIDSVAEVIRAVRSKSACDVLLMTPAFGTTDPRDDRQWREIVDPGGTDFRAKLVRLADEQKVGLIDMTAAWGRYVRASGKEIGWFKRDVVHANERGEQVVGRILAAHLASPVTVPGK